MDFKTVSRWLLWQMWFFNISVSASFKWLLPVILTWTWYQSKHWNKIPLFWKVKLSFSGLFSAVAFSDIISRHSPYCYQKYQMPLTNWKNKKANNIWWRKLCSLNQHSDQWVLIDFFFLSRPKKLLELPDETLCFYLTLIKVWITEVRSYVVMCKSDWKQLNNLADSSFKYFSSCLYFWIFK